MVNQITVDLAVLGGGPGGYVAALKASQLGGKVALIEKEGLGGVCTHRGCIPTKALLHSASLIEGIKSSNLHGITVNGFSVDFHKTMDRVHRVVNRLAKGVEYLLERSGVKILRGTGRIKTHDSLEVKPSDGDGELDVKYGRLIIATGSHPFKVPIPGIDGRNVYTSDDVFKLENLPRSIVIIGGGAVGVEFATIMNGLGCEVSLIEMMPQLIPSEDRSAGNLLKKELERRGVKVEVGAKVIGVSDKNGVKRVEAVKDSEKLCLEGEIVLCASGRTPNTQNLGLEVLKIELTDKGFIRVNERMETNVPGVYAVGDVVGRFLLAHTAMQEGLVAAENAMGGEASMDYRVVPRCVYSQPEAAFIGLSEDSAREKGYEVDTAEFPLIANGRALTLDSHTGMVKLVYGRKFGEILGAVIVAPEASEIIHEVALAMRLEATVDDLAGMIHAHPTLSEILREAALRASGKPLHG
ncbi:MAG: dihydrolipoyl dehydrogenase [Candidatus Bathyarchaeia archaeon]|nr:dihydrolipoyl dehydrogenase [Candidatus Bathyarchaeota archaeon]